MLRLISRLMPTRSPANASPTHSEILNARKFLQSGELDKAEEVCRQVISENPGNAEAYDALGGVAFRRGSIELAIEHFSKAVELDSNQASFFQSLGLAYCSLGKFAKAIDYFQRALILDPKNLATQNNLGNCYKQEDKLADAARCYRKAISLRPTYLLASINLADVLGKQHKHKAAIKTYRKALRLGTNIPENQMHLAVLHHGLGLALRELDKTDEAIAAYKEAISIQPDFALAHNSLGAALLARNEVDAAITSFRRALEIEPNLARVHSNILLVMNYLANSTQEQLYAESRKFDSQHAKGLRKRRDSFRNSRNRKRPLKIGYLSPDFQDHSVAHFTRKLPREHNREAVEVFCYSDVETPDYVTAQFQAQTDHWLSIAKMDDDEVAACIRRDRIDILVDLAGHTSRNRLLLFAQKPAPVQVSWLGYPNTTGLKTMDYRLTDSVADPLSEADRLYTEKLIRLEHGFLCYQTDESILEVSSPPCLKQGHITFGSFNSISKVTPDVVGVWSRILQSVPDSRLVLKAKALEDSGTRMRLLQAFREHGIDSDRLDLINMVAGRKDHMKLYSRVDIGLDPFPYNGTTTTCEALWMSVPVITLCGDRHAGRVGASIMHHVGLPSLVAQSSDEYVNVAKYLANDTQELTRQRKTIRAQMQQSALMDVPAFVATLENAYRKMWVNWCNKNQ